MAEISKWYVVHTYSGYENKVKTDLEKTIDPNMFIENIVFNFEIKPWIIRKPCKQQSLRIFDFFLS